MPHNSALNTVCRKSKFKKGSFLDWLHAARFLELEVHLAVKLWCTLEASTATAGNPLSDRP
eukprot:463695-Pelagomonas_calceolata.AAC.2